MKLEYVSRPGSGASSSEIQKITVALQSIEKKFGCVTPNVVVKAAAAADSPLHKFFEWNNGAAATKYRLWQARQLIAKVYVIDNDRPEIGPVRAFVNLELPPLVDEEESDEDQANQRAYMSIKRLNGQQDFSSQLLAYAYTQLLGWKKRFGNYKQFLEVAKEIDKVKV